MNFKTLAQRTFKIKYFFGSNEQKPPKINKINPNFDPFTDFGNPWLKEGMDRIDYFCLFLIELGCWALIPGFEYAFFYPWSKLKEYYKTK